MVEESGILPHRLASVLVDSRGMGVVVRPPVHKLLTVPVLVVDQLSTTTVLLLAVVVLQAVPTSPPTPHHVTHYLLAPIPTILP